MPIQRQMAAIIANPAATTTKMKAKLRLSVMTEDDLLVSAHFRGGSRISS
jgi:hypothetical protein